MPVGIKAANTSTISGHADASAAVYARQMTNFDGCRIAVTGARRSQAAPELPTVAEAAFPGFEATTWYGMFVPAGTPATIVAKLNSEVVKVLRVPEFRDWLIAQGADPVGGTPEELAAFVKAELVKYAKIVKDSGMRPD